MREGEKMTSVTIKPPSQAISSFQVSDRSINATYDFSQFQVKRQTTSYAIEIVENIDELRKPRRKSSVEKEEQERVIYIYYDFC